MIVLAAVVTLAVLALITQAGVSALESTYPPQGKFVDVKGARLHVVELGPTYAPGLPIVLIHEALGKLGVDQAIIVGHSWAGSLMPALALEYPRRVAGIMMLSPVAYPWPGGVGRFNKIATIPVIGPLLAYTITLPLGVFLIDGGTRYVFAPQTMPDGYIDATAVRMVLRPQVFLDNAWDLTTLKAEVAKQSPNYPSIRVPVTIITGDADKTVSTDIHSRPCAAAVPQTKLVVLPNGGHMPQVYATDLIVAEIEAISAKAQAFSATARR